MPKKLKSESVLHTWVCELTFQMQALLLTAMRGPDENNKFNSAKGIVRYLRGVVIKPAGDWNGENNNDFMWGDYMGTPSHPLGPKPAGFEAYANGFFDDHDEYPHHFIMHLVHCAEVVGYKHPDSSIARYWLNFYNEACGAFHMNPETEEEMDMRLNDFGCGWHNERSNDEPYEAGPGISTKHTSQCLRKAGDDEPIFVLRAKDPTAPPLIRKWAEANQNWQPEAKRKGALELATEMEVWRKENIKA